MERLFNPLESASRLQGILTTAGIESIVIGGIAVAIWGEPRATKDADLKVLLQRDQSARLIKALPSEFHLLSKEPEETLQRLGFLFVQDVTGIRLDLLLAETAFDAEAVARGIQMEPLPGIKMKVCTPEDLIIYKIISTRPRDHEDAAGIVNRQKDVLNEKYIENWLKQFEQALNDSTLVSSYHAMQRR